MLLSTRLRATGQQTASSVWYISQSGPNPLSTSRLSTCFPYPGSHPLCQPQQAFLTSRMTPDPTWLANSYFSSSARSKGYEDSTPAGLVSLLRMSCTKEPLVIVGGVVTQRAPCTLGTGHALTFGSSSLHS